MLAQFKLKERLNQLQYLRKFSYLEFLMYPSIRFLIQLFIDTLFFKQVSLNFATKSLGSFVEILE